MGFSLRRTSKHEADDAVGTFVLGVGAQKAGTTWLYAYLRQSPEFRHGFRKEYHVFDSLDVPSEQWMRDRILRMADDELQKARKGEPADAEQLHRAAMYADPKFYYDYFAGLLATSPRARAVGDVTPDYAFIPRERYADIKEQFRRRRVRTVAVFLMRDPVDRIYSHIRMRKGRQPDRFPEPAEELLARTHTGENYQLRTRYHQTIENVDAVFGPDEVHYGFYEELFSVDEVRRITDLVGIPFHAPDFDERRNASKAERKDELPESLVAEVAQNLADTYRGVAARFPDKDLTEIWPSARHVL
jgi:hypothetical protein